MSEPYRKPIRYTQEQLVQFIKDDLNSDLATAEDRLRFGQNVGVNKAVAAKCRAQLKILAETPDVKLDQYGWPTCLPK